MSDSNKKSQLKLTDEDYVNLGICPNCWGEQQWEGKFIQFEMDRERDVINGDQEAQKAFIQKFVEEHVDGIQLIDDLHVKTCPVCKIQFGRDSH